MINEIKTRQIQHKRTLEYAYQQYKKVAVVNEDLIEPTVQLSHKKDNIFVVNNLINYKNVLEKAQQEDILFDTFTESNTSLEFIKQILKSDAKKFITIGRFSPEKGHKRLIEAYNKIYQENPNTYLLIIGGNGKKYQEIVELVNSLSCKEHIILIKTISNPYNILKQCDYFVLSSYYEGFGLVIAEADILKKPVISTDVIGPRNFILQNNGTLVENTAEGLYKGMKLLLNNQVKVLNVNYEQYNQQALQEFYTLLNDGEKE